MQRYLFCLTLLGLFLFAACAGRAPQNDQAATTRDDKMTTSAVTTTPGKSLPKIVAFGDSLTAGLGLSTAESYPSVLQEKLRADGYQYEVVNAGVSGDTSAGGVRRVDWSLEGDVRVVIIELGANDLLRGQPVAEMKKNLGAIIERAESRNAKVLLAGMYSLTSLGSDYQREVHEAFQSLAREHDVPLIPFFLEGVAGDAKLNQPDGVHPNADGTRIVAETVYRYLRPMLDEEK
ncbi:MAG TPA: arylesterase [Pyrinomonadaceae bacterium]|nr:arylesterase [Pyrinomonadaceae bacterium]